MAKFTLFFAALLFCATHTSAQMLDTVRIQMTGMDGTVPISTDDAEQLNNEIDKLFDDDLDMGWEGDEFNIAITGLRFHGIDVPQGAIIDSAFIEIYAHEDEGDTCFVTIRVENNSNPKTYNDTDLITDRVYVKDSIFWPITEDWEIWTLHRSPELKNLVQAVVNRSDWQVGGGIAFMFSGQDQGASSEDNARDFEAFENVEDPDDGGDGLNHPERIPKLYIYWRPMSAVRQPVTVTELSVSPNPVQNGIITVDVVPFQGQDAVISLSAMDGRVLRQWQLANVQQSKFQAAVNGVPAGIYRLEVLSKEKAGVARVVVE